MPKDKCDFCSSLDVRWRYPAISFPCDDIPASSEGDWAACEICHQIMKHEGQPGITRRAIDTLCLDKPHYLAVLPDLTKWMTKLHKQFWKHRLGQPIPVESAQSGKRSSDPDK